jgi:similar to stage IV sporulation protein
MSKKITKLCLCFIILIVSGLIISSRYIWNITVTGCTYYTEEQIKSWVYENAVAIGSKKKNIVCSELEYSIKEELKAVDWVSCSIDKTTLIIDIYDSAEYESDSLDGNDINVNRSVDIVSDTDCIVTEIIPVAGTALVSVGDEVKKGDVLISGEVTIYNDYGEEVDTAYVESQGYIIGLVTEQFNETINLNRQEKIYADYIKGFGLGFGDSYINILYPEITSLYDVEIEVNNLKIGKNFCLPFSIATYEIHPYTVAQTESSQQELKTILQKRIDAYMSDLRKKGVEIVENNVKIYSGESGCTAKGSILYKKTIGCKGD